MSQLTTHVLDTSRGVPAAGIPVLLIGGPADHRRELARGMTNADGRVPDLLPSEKILEPGIYQLRFEAKAYFDSLQIRSFYPFVEISFEISSREHYHVPLLLSPFGFSTYRGS